MKGIDLFLIYNTAKDSCDYQSFEQRIKVELTGQPYTVEIDCIPVVVDFNKLNECCNVSKLE